MSISNLPLPDYNTPMSASLSQASKKDPGPVGLGREDLPPIGDSPEATRLDERTLRGLWGEGRRDRPVELEIGSGKGTFLVQQAERMPNVNYLGVEYAHAYWLHAADRCRRRGLPNVRMLHHDAAVFVPWYLPDAALRQVHAYFLDPWPKKRHHKRRLITSAFLTQLHRVLEPGGMIRLVTDHTGYFEWMTEAAEAVNEEVGGRLERLPFERPIGAGEGEVVGTNFERKYRREGRPFHAMTLRRVRYLRTPSKEAT